MKAILGWMKSHIAIVVCVAIIVLSIPSALVGSLMWNSSIRKARQAQVDTDSKELQGGRISYTLPAVLPGVEPVSLTNVAPNKELSRIFGEWRQKQEVQVTEVVQAVEAFNRQGHDVMLPDLFPKPTGSPTDADLKQIEMAELIAGKPGKPSIYERLLTEVRAGGPADAPRLASLLDEARRSFMDKERAETGQDRLSPEKEDELLARLLRLRIGEYQRRAGEISFYAVARDMLSKSIFFPSVPKEPLGVERMFIAQWDAWVVADVLRAVRAANTGADGQWAPLESAVVKRVEKIDVEQLPVFEASGAERGPRGLSEVAATADGRPGQDWYVSITGRTSSKANELYDVRHATLVAVVSSARLPLLLEAISRTNLMSVIGLELVEVDVWKDLEDGYYYGQEHVVRATIQIETIWMRSWTGQVMPDALKTLLHFAGFEAAEDAGSTEPAPAPPPRRAAPRGGDEEEGGGRRRPGRRDDGGG